jgi:KUP system potassium uptake protein
MLMTWKAGSGLVAEQRRKMDIPVADFLSGPQPDAPRVPGTAVYLTSDPVMVPSALFHNLKHYKVMHERTVFLHVVAEEVPRVDPQSRIRFKQLGPNIHSIAVHYGFREEPDLPDALKAAPLQELKLDPIAPRTLSRVRPLSMAPVACRRGVAPCSADDAAGGRCGNLLIFRRTGWWSWGRR